MMLENQDPPKKILLVRTDRMGDVVLTTPVCKPIKEQFPTTHLAMLVAKENEELVRGHPYLDEVIVYDRKGSEGRHLIGFLNFVWDLRKKKFDVAIHFHPRNRAYWISFLSGIPMRVGYRYKNYFLLTTTHPYDKPEGKKHEAEYNFDLLEFIGVKRPPACEPLITVMPDSEMQLRKHLELSEPYAVFNPSASSKSKMWPAEFFAEIADTLFEKYGWRPVIIGGSGDVATSEKMKRNMRQNAVDLTGKLSLGALAPLFKNAKIFISNDTGPVHVASAVGAKTISIFLRDLAGLGPQRWRPLGPNSRFLLEEVVKTIESSINGQIEASDVQKLLPSVVFKEIEDLTRV